MTPTNTLRIALWILALALCAGTLSADAGDTPAGAPAPVKAQGERCPAGVAEVAAAPAPGDLATDLFASAPSLAAICPLIGCADDVYCRRDRDCTAAPNGTCRLFCPQKGCCAYP